MKHITTKSLMQGMLWLVRCRRGKELGIVMYDIKKRRRVFIPANIENVELSYNQMKEITSLLRGKHESRVRYATVLKLAGSDSKERKEQDGRKVKVGFLKESVSIPSVSW